MFVKVQHSTTTRKIPCTVGCAQTTCTYITMLLIPEVLPVRIACTYTPVLIYPPQLFSELDNTYCDVQLEDSSHSRGSLVDDYDPIILARPYGLITLPPIHTSAHPHPIMHTSAHLQPITNLPIHTLSLYHHISTHRYTLSHFLHPIICTSTLHPHLIPPPPPHPTAPTSSHFHVLHLKVITPHTSTP